MVMILTKKTALFTTMFHAANAFEVKSGVALSVVRKQVVDRCEESCVAEVLCWTAVVMV